MSRSRDSGFGGRSSGRSAPATTTPFAAGEWGSAVFLLVLAGCGSSSTTVERRCGAVDPTTSDIFVCGASQLCACGTGECVVHEPLCAGSHYRVVTEAGDGRCLSRAEAAWLVPATPEDHPLCTPAADADADADADAEQDAEAGAEAEVGPDEWLPDVPGSLDLVVFSMQEMRSGDPDRRRIERDVTFPVPQTFEQVLLVYDMHHGCPDLCDTRAPMTNVTLGFLDGRELELLRAAAPIGADARFILDVTDLQPVFTHRKTIAVFIDTTEGAWEVDLRLFFVPGDAPRPVLDVVPIFDEQDYRATTDIAEAIVEILPEVREATLVYRGTGHTTAGDGGCDETCERTTHVAIDGEDRFQATPWRTDCASFVGRNPAGDPAMVGRSRSGWCPGDLVADTTLDATEWLGPGEHEIDLGIADVDPETGYWRASLFLVLYE